MFSTQSRYYELETAEWRAADGRTLVYVRRRFVPQPGREPTLAEHVVASGDRLDNVTARYLADGELFWRVCDANGAVEPEELCAEIGRVLRVPLPGGG